MGLNYMATSFICFSLTEISPSNPKLSGEWHRMTQGAHAAVQGMLLTGGDHGHAATVLMKDLFHLLVLFCIWSTTV